MWAPKTSETNFKKWEENEAAPIKTLDMLKAQMLDLQTEDLAEACR